MSKPLKVANAQAFWGDRNDAASELVSQVPDLDYLTLDYLAEVSLSIMAQQQVRDPHAGYAKDFVEGMWLMLQQDKPDDFVLATGETTTVRKFVEIAFAEMGMAISWRGKGLDEKGIDAQGNVRVEISPELFRPAEVDLLIGDPAKARAALGWTPKTTIQELVKMMVHADFESVSKGQLLARQ